MAAVPSIGRASAVEARPAAPEADLTRALYERHSRQIFSYCLHQLGNREEAEDATQTTFMNAFRGLQRGVVPELESAWLYKIANNVILTRRRSSSRRRRVETPGDLDAIQDLLPSRERDADELIRLTDALSGMPEQQRRALLLREWQGLSYREIGEELGLTQPAVETLLFRARRSLAQGLTDPEAADTKRRGSRLRGGLDLGSVLAGLKGLIGGGAAVKAAATAAVVASSAVVATDPALHHRVAPLPAPTAPAPAAAKKAHVAAPAPAPLAAPAPVAAPTAAAPVSKPKWVSRHAAPRHRVAHGDTARLRAPKQPLAPEPVAVVPAAPAVEAPPAVAPAPPPPVAPPAVEPPAAADPPVVVPPQPAEPPAATPKHELRHEHARPEKPEKPEKKVERAPASAAPAAQHDEGKQHGKAEDRKGHGGGHGHGHDDAPAPQPVPADADAVAATPAAAPAPAPVAPEHGRSKKHDRLSLPAAPEPVAPAVPADATATPPPPAVEAPPAPVEPALEDASRPDDGGNGHGRHGGGKHG